MLGFVGFEGAVVYSEEARDPHRTVRIASYVAVGVIAGLYTLGSWAMSVATGPDQIVAQSQSQSTELIFTLAGSHLGGMVVDIGHALFVTSVLAAMISLSQHHRPLHLRPRPRTRPPRDPRPHLATHQLPQARLPHPDRVWASW